MSTSVVWQEHCGIPVPAEAEQTEVIDAKEGVVAKVLSIAQWKLMKHPCIVLQWEKPYADPSDNVLSIVNEAAKASYDTYGVSAKLLIVLPSTLDTGKVGYTGRLELLAQTVRLLKAIRLQVENSHLLKELLVFGAKGRLKSEGKSLAKMYGKDLYINPYRNIKLASEPIFVVKYYNDWQEYLVFNG